MKSIFRGAIDLVEEKKNTYTFILKDKEYQEYFEAIKQFVKVNVERKVAFQFEAETLITLKDFLKRETTLSYNECCSLFLDIGEQLKTLSELGKGYLSIDFEDIIFIKSDEDNISMIFLNIDESFLVKNNVLEVSKPYKKHEYFSPQMKLITQIPTNINYKQS